MSRVPQRLRKLVRERAQGRCEYCGKPEEDEIYPHHVEHIIARKHGGPTIADNLAWACIRCNMAKGTDIATIEEESGALTRLFDPRVQRWEEHFLLEASMHIIGLTVVGRATVALLNLNEPDEVEARRQLREAGQW